MKNSGGHFFSSSSHNFFQLIMREDCHHQICTWEVQWKDQELLDPAILAASVDSRMESKCKPPKSRLLLQGNSGVLAGREAQADRTLRWIKQGMRKTQTPQEELLKAVRELLCAMPSTQTPWATLAVKMIWLHFFKNVISLPTVKNIFVISCWFCWSSGNGFASEILKG